MQEEMLRHLLPVSLSWGQSSRAHWALNPSGNVVVFVHGFNGSAVGTWAQFDSLLPPETHDDLVFYGYDSLKLRATVMAAQLREFLRDLCLDSVRTVNGSVEPELHRDEGFRVRRVVLVAHSLGAVVCRQALLDAVNYAEHWVTCVRLVLFAPAHMGSPLPSLISRAAGSFPLPWAWARYYYPILSELEEGSCFLGELRQGTQAALHNGNSQFLCACAVAICERDTLVSTQQFCVGDACPIILRKDHLSICKPHEDYLKPLEIVRGVTRL